MKKNFIKVKDFVNLQSIKKKINDALTGEKSAELKDALIALITELDTSEAEIDEKAFADQVAEIIKGYMADPNADVPAAVANAIAAKVKGIQDSIRTEGGDKLPAKVKNEIANAIIFGKADKTSIKNAVEKILVENGVTGLTFGETIDYAIATKWEDLNPLFAKLKKTFISKFFYSTQEMNAAELIAKQWSKTLGAGVQKDIQSVTSTPKAITTDYVYARQQLNNSDLDDIAEVGQESAFLAWINNELDLMLVNTIVMAILVGDTINAVGKRITTFETIGTKAATDAFTVVAGPATPNQPTVTDVRLMCDKVYNPAGKEKILVMSQALLTELSAYKYAAGGDTYYRTAEEMAGQFGVNSIYITDVLANLAGVHAICLIPDGYWYKEKKYISVSWPTYEENRVNYQKERNIGGKIHDLLSTAVLKEGGEVLNDTEPVG
jgi:YHS domain-containing protein